MNNKLCCMIGLFFLTSSLCCMELNPKKSFEIQEQIETKRLDIEHDIESQLEHEANVDDYKNLLAKYESMKSQLFYARGASVASTSLVAFLIVLVTFKLTC